MCMCLMIEIYAGANKRLSKKSDWRSLFECVDETQPFKFDPIFSGSVIWVYVLLGANIPSRFAVLAVHGKTKNKTKNCLSNNCMY